MGQAIEGGRGSLRRRHVVIAAAFSLSMVLLGAIALAPLVGAVFAPGFLGGLGMWLARPSSLPFATIKWPWLLAIGTYVVHRVDEEISGFVPAIEQLTGQEAAATLSAISLTLAGCSLAWMLSPLLLLIEHPLGQYGAWTLFAGFGVIELAHFVFPLLSPGPYGYFPGMVTAPLIAAAGWWGLWRLWRGSTQR